MPAFLHANSLVLEIAKHSFPVSLKPTRTTDPRPYPTGPAVASIPTPVSHYATASTERILAQAGSNTAN